MLRAEVAKDERKATRTNTSRKRLSYSYTDPAYETSDDDEPQLASKGKKKKKLKTKKDEREEELERTIDEIRQELNNKGEKYSAAQVRLWAEMILVGTHLSRSTPPKIPALGFKNMKKPSIAEKLTESIGTMASSIASVVSPCQNGASNGSGGSVGSNAGISLGTVNVNNRKNIPFEQTTPGRKAKLRNECLRQLRELKELKDAGILSSEEFEKHKKDILNEM